MKTSYLRRGFTVNQKETPPILKSKELIFRNLKRPEQPKYYELFPKSKHHLCDTIDVENPWLFMNQERFVKPDEQRSPYVLNRDMQK